MTVKAIVNVNGTPMACHLDEVTYRDVLALSGKAGEPTVTYAGWVGGVHTAGTLYPNGPAIAVADGMRFTVIHTGAA